MPQVLLLAALGGALYAGYRAITRVGDAMREELRRAEEAARQRSEAANADAARNLGELEYDPKSGVYKAKPKS